MAADSQEGSLSDTSHDVEISGFGTSLDFENLDVMTAEEAAALLEWYESSHSDGEGQLTSFVPFLIENSPATLKLYRAYVQSLDELGALPQVIVALLFLHYYMSIGNESGTHYEVIAALQWGATKQEVLETIGSTFVESGPFGGNTAAVSQKYLAAWDASEPRRMPFSWPTHWRSDVVDSATIPPQSPTARLLAGRAPHVLSALQARRVRARRDNGLPPAFLFLCDLHVAVARGRAADAAKASEAALNGGVTVAEVIEVVGFAALYATAFQLDEIAAAIDPVLPATS
jgi:alkylhydroperoxidase/carboxymuconolactone decarboxylase family protein YurZ